MILNTASNAHLVLEEDVELQQPLIPLLGRYPHLLLAGHRDVPQGVVLGEGDHHLDTHLLQGMDRDHLARRGAGLYLRVRKCRLTEIHENI